MAKHQDIPRNIAMTLKITEQQKEEIDRIAAYEDVKSSYLAYKILQTWLEDSERVIPNL